MDVKEKILKVAREEFAKSGFRNVRTDELSQKIGISKRTLYENFQSKEQLFEEVINIEIQNIDVIIDEVLDKLENDPDANLIDEIKKLWRIDADSAFSFTKDMFLEMQKYTPYIWEKVLKFRQGRMEAVFFRIVESGKKKGAIREDMNAGILFLLHYTISRNIFNSEIILKHDITPKELIDTIYNILFIGVLTDDAREYYLNNC